MKIGLACDHAGYFFKEKIKEYLIKKSIEVNDFGCFSTDSVDYPDFAHQLAISVEKKESNIGIQLCGTGNGINMTANKHQSIRAALCWNTHIAEQARLHNDANILTLPARQLNWEEIKNIIEIFLNTSFEGGRHTNRINKIKNEF